MNAENSKDKQTIAKLKKVVTSVTRRLGSDTGRLLGINTHGWNVILSGDRVLHVEKRHGMNGEHDTSMADLQKWEQIPWIFKHFDEIEEAQGKSHVKGRDNKPAPQILIKKRVNGIHYIASAVVDTKNKALHITSVFTGPSNLMIGPNANFKKQPSDYVQNALPPGDKRNISQNEENVNPENLFGNLREGDLDAHLQARRDAMPKMGLEAARANVQAALNREPGETRKAWAKRKLKATSDFIVEQTSDARLPVIDAMREITGKTTHSERTDIPLAMQLSYGRVFEQHLNIDQNFVIPTLQILADNGLDIETLDTYLVTMHAPERNKMIKERTAFGNSKGNLSGSGITDEVAAKRIDELRKRLTQRQFDALNRAASRVWELNRSNLDRLAAYGIMSEEQTETWKKRSPHYVPLRGEMPPSTRHYGAATFFRAFRLFRGFD